MGESGLRGRRICRRGQPAWRQAEQVWGRAPLQVPAQERAAWAQGAARALHPAPASQVGGYPLTSLSQPSCT